MGLSKQNMLATCDHCGHRSDVPDSAANTEVICERCRQAFIALSPEENAANRRATKILLSAVLLFFAVMALLLFFPSRSGFANGARRAVFGSAVTGRFGGEGNGEGANGTGDGARTGTATTEGSGNRSAAGAGGSASGSGGGAPGLPDPLATESARPTGRSIGRAPQSLGARKPGDEVRAGAAGTDDPAGAIGNSRSGQVTNAPSAGANPGNSDSRNSAEPPEGNDPITGRGAGAEATTATSTNSRNTALLLDDFSERLRQAGARSGDVQVSLEWQNVNDLDLHVIDPSGERIFYSHPQSRSGGVLDVDMNRGGGESATTLPVENIYWPERGAPRGVYRVEVVHFANHGGRDPTQFTVRINNKGQSSFYRGYVTFLSTPERARVRVCTFTVQ